MFASFLFDAQNQSVNVIIHYNTQSGLFLLDHVGMMRFLSATDVDKRFTFA